MVETVAGMVNPLHRGRPTAYQPEFAQQAQKLARVGLTLSEIAEFLEVDERTVRRWRQAHDDFDQALKLGTEVANRRVEASLYQQAIGYWIEDEEIKVLRGNIVRIKKRRFIPPSVTATIYWTKAKMGWRDDGSPQAPPDPPGPSDTPKESPRERARRLAFILYQGGLKPGTT